MKTQTFNKRPPRFGAAGLGLLSGLLLAGMAPAALAVDDPGDPSGDGIEPTFVAGNPSCSTIGLGYGFKIDSAPIGTFTFTNPPGTLTGGAPSDPNNSVTISNSDGILFDWSATLGIDAVIVKGGPNADAFVYNPEDLADTDLHAPVNPSNGQYFGISHIEFCYDYELSASKTANAQFTRTYSWTIDKSVTPAAHSGFVGDTFSSDYDVFVDQTVLDSDFAVSGTITVENNTPIDGVSFDISDSVGGTNAVVDCGSGQASGTVDSGESVVCSYSAPLGGPNDGTNTATITSNTSGVGGATASANYAFGDPTTIVGYPTVNVTDSVQGPLGSASGDITFEYTRNFSCSSNPGDYTNGVDTDLYPNTATITETGQTDSENVTVTCYIPVVSKTAQASFDKTYTWNINKVVDEESQSGYPGDVLPWTWTVTVTSTSEESDFEINGVITVQNPNPSAPMTVAVADTLDDGTPVTLTCGGSLNVPAGGSATCNYSAAPNDKTATLNTATATLNGVSVSGTAAVSFVLDDTIGGTATVTDSQGGFSLNESVTARDEPYEYTSSEDHTCSSSYSDYGEDGLYTDTRTNNASVTDSEGNTSSDDATTTYTCEAGFVTLLKHTEGAADPTRSWTFKVYEGPDGFGGTQMGSTGSTFGDGDGLLDFNQPVLNPEETYTICELGVPAGWSTFWQVNGATVVPYNPDADDPVPADLGNRCVDFGAGTAIPVSVGDTVEFYVNNTFPGGAPRTPGYWKNWNRCSTGGQADNADRQGGYTEGYWLLEDVLNPAIGGGIVWDDILTDSFGPVEITSCEEAVEILDQRVVNVNGKVGDGKKLASDAARTLAMHLLAAQLNLGAGACTTTEVNQKVLAAETLLDGLNFDGTKSTAYLTSKSAGYADALSLASYLDQYNNGAFCGDFD